MPIYLIAAYIVFFVVPVGLGISILIRKRRVQRNIIKLQAQTANQVPPNELEHI